MNSLSDRIAKILKYSDLNASGFAKLIGCTTTQAVYDLLKGKTKSLSPSMQTKILSYMPNLRLEWLLCGEGAMLKADPDLPDAEKVAEFYKSRYEFEIEGLKRLLEERDKKIRELECRLISNAQ